MHNLSQSGMDRSTSLMKDISVLTLRDEAKVSNSSGRGNYKNLDSFGKI